MLIVTDILRLRWLTQARRASAAPVVLFADARRPKADGESPTSQDSFDDNVPRHLVGIVRIEANRIRSCCGLLIVAIDPIHQLLTEIFCTIPELTTDMTEGSAAEELSERQERLLLKLISPIQFESDTRKAAAFIFDNIVQKEKWGVSRDEYLATIENGGNSEVLGLITRMNSAEFLHRLKWLIESYRFA